MSSETLAWTAYGFAWELNEERREYLGRMAPEPANEADWGKALTTFVQEVAENAGYAPENIAASISGNQWTGEEWFVVSVEGTSVSADGYPRSFFEYADEPSQEDREALTAVARFIGYSGKTGRMFGQDVY